MCACLTITNIFTLSLFPTYIIQKEKLPVIALVYASGTIHRGHSTAGPFDDAPQDIGSLTVCKQLRQIREDKTVKVGTCLSPNLLIACTHTYVLPLYQFACSPSHVYLVSFLCVRFPELALPISTFSFCLWLVKMSLVLSFSHYLSRTHTHTHAFRLWFFVSTVPVALLSPLTLCG